VSASILRAGDLVYRVIEIDPPNEGPITWQVTSAVVKSASAKQIQLKTYLPGLWRTRFKPNMLGRTFFETPLGAIQWFSAAQRGEIETMDRRRKQAERAIAWATAQEGVK
jgi:hypothetical protein